MKEQWGHYVVMATLMDTEILDRWLRSFGESVWNVEKTVVVDSQPMDS